jgi:hypothetical protein
MDEVYNIIKNCTQERIDKSSLKITLPLFKEYLDPDDRGSELLFNN